MSSWMVRRAGRSNRGKVVKEEPVIDFTKDPSNVMGDILMGICVQVDKEKLKYLKAFVQLNKHIHGDYTSINYEIKEILICLRVALVDLSTQVRSAGLRAMRHVISGEEDILCFNKLVIPYLIARSLDLVLKNDIERLEAMKLIRKVLLLSPLNFHASLVRSLISLVNGDTDERREERDRLLRKDKRDEKDRLLRITLATLCELGVLNSNLFLECGGVAAITRNLLECQIPKIAESLCGVLLLLLDHPRTRNVASVNLLAVAAPYCDFHYKHGWKDSRDERDLRFTSSRLAMLSILKSWPGILHICSPQNASGLNAIVDILYLNQLGVRKAVLDLLYELLGLPQPEWTDELSVALSAVDPCEPQASWRLNEGFIVAEGRSVLPHLAKTTPSIINMHLAVLLYCFYNNGLINALVEVIATSDTFISVRATVLLGELLRLIQVILPPECCNTAPALPTLLNYATKNTPKALGAVTALQQYHKLLKKRPASNSLYLDYILKSGSYLKLSTKKNKLINRYKSRSVKSKIHQFVINNGDDIIKGTGVLIDKDHNQWNWNLIRIIVKGESGLKVVMTESSHKMFFKRLVDFYLPTNKLYSHKDLNPSKTCLAYTMAGLELIQFLIDLNENECIRLLMDLFKDILNHIIAITSGKSVHDCLFSPAHMVNTQSQNYFLFIGRLATSESGINLLNQIKMFQCLQNLATTTNNDCYVKLIISSMDYTNPSPCRNLLTAILKSNNETSRLYATQFLLILLRSGIPNFVTWGIEALVNQLSDTCKAVSLAALSVLHEACETTDGLETLVKIPFDIDSVGEKGTMLLAKLLSNPKGFAKYNGIKNLTAEIKRWDEYFIFRYVKQVEDETSDALTLHQRGEDGKYDKRISGIKVNGRRELYLPPHLYGQLSQHTEGFNLLLDKGSIASYFEIVAKGKCDSEEEILNLKAAIWSVAQFCTSHKGLQLLLSEDMISNIICLAQHCAVYSIRATAYYALGLIGTTHSGADELFKLGWVCTRHDMHDAWPIIQEEVYNNSDSENESEDSFLECSLTDSPTTFTLSHDRSFMSDHDRLGSPDKFPSYRKKSSTLPSNQANSTVFHQRSMSESKTFEMLKGYEKKLRERVGLSTQYSDQSNTSSISSYDSLMGGNTLISQVQPLSPIPSSSNITTVKRSERKIRRHSESCRHDSTHSGYREKKSSFHNSLHKLSPQDLTGYTTIHCLRRFNSNSETEMGTTNQIPKSFHSMNKIEKGLSVEDFIFKSSLSSLASLKKFCVDEKPKQRGSIYMGICLPQNLSDLFPDKEVPTSSKCSDADSQSSLPTSIDTRVSYDSRSRKTYVHNDTYCLECSKAIDRTIKKPVTENRDPERLAILKQIEQLSNPLGNRQPKLALLQHKQANSPIFQDVCLYSEVCRMISEHYFRLANRRMIHELFFEVHYVNLLEEAKIVVFSRVPKTSVDDSKTESEISICKDNTKVISAEDSPTKELDLSDYQDDKLNQSGRANVPNSNSISQLTNISGLKLLYKENKFPIKNRDM